MSTQKNGSATKDMLKNLCCDNGWSYGVFWSFNEQNPLLLTFQDAYYDDEQMGVSIDEMLLQVHMLGEGLIGRAAFTKKQLYIFSDTHHTNQNPIGSTQATGLYQGDCDFFGQFSTGIKTIAIIPVEPFGVAQFGSFQKLPERMEFVKQTKILFSGILNGGGIIGSEKKCLYPNDENFGLNGLFASLISGTNSGLASSSDLYSAGEELMEATFSPSIQIQTFPSSSNDQQMSYYAEALINCDGYVSNVQPQHSFPQPAFRFDHAVVGASCSSTWSCGHSALTSSMQPLSSPIRPYNSHDLISTKHFNNGCFTDATENAQESATALFCSGNLMDNCDSSPWWYSSEGKHQGPMSVSTFEEVFQENDIANTFSRSCPGNEFSQLLSGMPDRSTNVAGITLNKKGLPYEANSASASSNFKEYVELISENHPSNSVQSCITNLFTSIENEKPAETSGIEKFLDSFRGNPGCRTSGRWNNILEPAAIANNLSSGASYSKCILRPPKKLFSGSGKNQVLDNVTSGSCSIAISSLEDQLSSANKRRKVETSLPSNDQVKFASFSQFDGYKGSVHPLSKSDAIHELETNSLIGDSYSINAGKVSQFKQHEEPAKRLKKKAKPGTRPRPKDRQLIHDRLLELRKLIPNGEKMSIDGLLHRTIKQLIFLQSVTEHAERLKKADEPKDRTIPEDTPSTRDCGVTWACEVGDETMVCPLIVEDLNTPGQMSIEIQFEERDSFLDIVDIIRGFGLSVLKGKMEAREAKIHARFIVTAEGKRRVTRHEIFSSLVQLLQFSSSSGANTSDQFGHIVNGGDDLFNTRSQSTVPFPINIAETLHCAGL